jgi:TolB protein
VLGDEVRLPAAGDEVAARVRLRSNVPVDHLELVVNGEVQEIPLAGDQRSADTIVRVPIERSGWVLLRARTDRAVYPVLDLYPYATTSPVYVTVGARPARSKADAEYFLAWIDRLRAAAEASQDWNTADERRAVLDTLAKARAEFERRAKE